MLGALFVGHLAASDLFVAGALVASGSQLLTQGQTAEAIRVLQAATEIAPDSGFAWYRLARAYQVAGQGLHKLAALRRAREADPENREIAIAWGEALIWHETRVPIHTDCWAGADLTSPAT